MDTREKQSLSLTLKLLGCQKFHNRCHGQKSLYSCEEDTWLSIIKVERTTVDNNSDTLFVYAALLVSWYYYTDPERKVQNKSQQSR